MHGRIGMLIAQMIAMSPEVFIDSPRIDAVPEEDSPRRRQAPKPDDGKTTALQREIAAWNKAVEERKRAKKNRKERE